jgi:hypothetical protein
LHCFGFLLCWFTMSVCAMNRDLVLASLAWLALIRLALQSGSSLLLRQVITTVGGAFFLSLSE